VNRKPPLGQGNFRALKNRPDRDRELAFARAAKVETGASGLAFDLPDFLMGIAMRAIGAERPQNHFHGLASGVFISECSRLKVGVGHRSLSYDRRHTSSVTFVN
jgi:hypothetical protein